MHGGGNRKVVGAGSSYTKISDTSSVLMRSTLNFFLLGGRALNSDLNKKRSESKLGPLNVRKIDQNLRIENSYGTNTYALCSSESKQILPDPSIVLSIRWFLNLTFTEFIHYSALTIAWPFVGMFLLYNSYEIICTIYYRVNSIFQYLYQNWYVFIKF